jgi:hypothetical protein
MFAKSPDRFGFMIENTKKQLEKDPSNETLKKLIKFYEECRERDGFEEAKENDLEYDLRTSEFIINKCKNSEKYSQNLYAALCNNDFIKNDKEWHCSWRHAGGVIANLKEEGDYIDWYCSGMAEKEGYCSEGQVAEEIRIDLLNLGWEIK